jgi:hypothetical protein
MALKGNRQQAVGNSLLKLEQLHLQKWRGVSYMQTEVCNMKSWVKLGAVLLSCGALGWACSREQERRSPTEAAPVVEQPVAGTGGTQSAAVESVGSISGTVLYKGIWKPSAIAVSRDQEVCGKEKEDPSLVLSAQGANVAHGSGWSYVGQSRRYSSAVRRPHASFCSDSIL